MLTAAKVEDEIMRLSQRLEDATILLATQAREAAEAEVNHKSIYARARLGAQGTVNARDDVATLHSHTALMERKISEAVYDSTKQLCLTLRAQLDALRTIAANIRTQT